MSILDNLSEKNGRIFFPVIVLYFFKTSVLDISKDAF